MIILPWPPSSLSGHAKGHWRDKSGPTAEYRAIAFDRAEKAQATSPRDDGDILIHIKFVPANNRGDRMNYPGRLKPMIDGIADYLQVNDKRFLPSYEFAAPEKPGRVEVTLS